MAGRNQKYTYGTRGTPTMDALTLAVDALDLHRSAGALTQHQGRQRNDRAVPGTQRHGVEIHTVDTDLVYEIDVCIEGFGCHVLQFQLIDHDFCNTHNDGFNIA